MIIIFGKGKVGNGLKNFLTMIQSEFIMMDDSDYNEKNLTKAETIIVSPGVPPHHKLYQDFGNKIISELNFLGEWLDNNGLREQLIIIGISGTNGKSTTTHIAYELLNKIFKENNDKSKNTDVYLSGNFGTPLSETLTEIIKQNNKTSSHIIVTECSSFMIYKLQNFHFDYSILTNIEIDHLDRHPDKKDYAQAKLNLINFTTKQAFTTEEVFQRLDTNLQNKTTIFGYDYDITGTQFVGHHNKANIQSVYLLTEKILEDLNIASQNIRSKIKAIEPLAHRMQLYTTIDAVNIYDDSICTSAHAQENALKGLDKKVVLICGGHDKGDDFNYLGELYKDKVSYGIFIGLTALKFEKIFTEQKISFSTQKTLHDAIQTAFEYAKNNNLDLVFSPACSSFDMFKNVYHRIEEFEKEVKLLA